MFFFFSHVRKIQLASVMTLPMSFSYRKLTEVEMWLMQVSNRFL